MKCPFCEADNKEGAAHCRKCGTDITGSPPWRPTWRWHVKTLLIIYAVLVVLYFTIDGFLSRLPEPYRARPVPKDMTPWLK